MNQDKIALFGLGKLGLPLSLVFAQNLDVYSFDMDENKINSLNNDKSPFYEPNLDEYLKKAKQKIKFKTPKECDINDFDVAIILVNTPSLPNGEFSNQYVYDVLNKLCDDLNKTDKEDFLFIVSSTVMPGSHLDFIKTIESKTNRKLNDGFGYVYIPDLVALGSVINDFENPDLVIVGESSEKYGLIATDIYSKILKNNAPFVRMGLYESEITKISLNAYITMKISFANFIGNICDKLNCDSTKITKALGYDKRISPYYIKSGISFGGTCFPRDTWAFIEMSKNLGLDAIHIKAAQDINENQDKLLFEKVKGYKDKKIGILGLSFKPNTTVTTQSAGYFLYEKLKNENYNVEAFDPLIETSYTNLGLDKFVEECDVIVITHNDKKLMNNNLRNKILINPWNL
jgi:UDPglucose 6-dehydrogenase